jgi:signal transduction histidine kinase
MSVRGRSRSRRLTTILSSIGLSLAITALMSLLFHGRVRGDFMATGLVCALVVGVIIDRVTRQHREALRRLNADLERRVRDRTAELADLQRELMLRDRMATAGTMAAAIGHEIRSPLTVITLGASSLAEVDGTERETIDDIAEAARQIEVILRDLSSLATPVDEPPAPVDLAAVVASAARLARYQLGRRSRLEIAPIEVPRVLGVPARLVQVVLNLLTNAARAARTDLENPITVRAGSHGDVVVLEVADRGVGMDAATLARAGETFFTTRRDRGGTGLGLAVCRTILESSGGGMEITSAPDRGTTVRITLRVAAKPASA